MERLKEHCGVFGVYSYSDANVTPLIIKGLMGLQHRGQESFGIAVEGNESYKRPGLVYRGYMKDRETIDKMKGHSGIGHVRYSTSGSSRDLGSFHPVDVKAGTDTDIRLAHNGTISNTDDLKKALRSENVGFRENASDTELSAHLLAKFFEKSKDWVAAFESFDLIKNGSFSFTVQTGKGEILGARDGRGYKPLCYGYHEETNSYVIASESFALDRIGAKKLKDVEPGELVLMDKSGPRFRRFAPAKARALDAFEITYFAHPASTIDGIQVATARQNIGREMFRKFGIGGDGIVAIPESAYHAAEGYSWESGVPLIHALGKDRYNRKSVLRGFIQPSARKETAEGMYVVKELVAGKELVVIDDSIVRGDSSRVFTEMQRKAGAREISLLSTFPPIRYPCYMGIDFPSSEELIAYKAAAKEDLDKVGPGVARELDVKFVGYMYPADIAKATGLSLDSLCFACVNGDYSKLNFTPAFRSRREMKGE